MEVFKNHDALFTYNNEVYYLTDKKNATASLIAQCIQSSQAIWHFLCLLTNGKFTGINDKTLGLSKIKEACLNAETIIIGAYDSEGYIFWEKNAL